MNHRCKTDVDITIVTVNWFSYQLIKSLFENLNKKARHPDRIDYLIIDNTNGKDSELGKISQTGLHITVYHYDPKGAKGSFAHASALNLALSMLETTFTLIVDPDVYVFKDDWDDFFVNELQINGISAIGATYPQWQLGTYHNFPNPVFCFFRTDDFRKANADWSAYSKNPLVNLLNFSRRQILRLGILINRNRFQKYPFVRKFFKKLERIIGVCSPDTGNRIAKKARKKLLAGIVFDAVLPDDNVKAGGTESFKNLAGQYELYYYKNESILTHRYGTASGVWRTPRGKDTNFWRHCIEQLQNEIANHATEKKD
jgi:hypothetical protein